MFVAVAGFITQIITKAWTALKSQRLELGSLTLY